jgi:hypothetical protein
MKRVLMLAAVASACCWAQAAMHEALDADFAPRLFQAAPVAAEIWTFDRLDQIGGHKTTVLGHPRVIDSPVGKAVEFNGVDDALLVDIHPLAGAETFTWEIVFRPDAGGAPEQRFFHLQEKDPKTGEDTDARMLSEIRVVDGVLEGAGELARMTRAALPPAEFLKLP